MSERNKPMKMVLRRAMLFVTFVARNFAGFYPILALTLLVLVFEYAATSLMIPLSSGSAAADGTVIRVWRVVLEKAGMPESPGTWLWLFFVVMTARLLFGYLQIVLTTLLGKDVHRALSNKIFSHVVTNEPMTSVYTRSVGHYITLAGDDTFRCGTIIASFLLCGVSLCTALVALVVLFQFSPLLFAMVAGFLIACAIVIFFLFKRILAVNEQANALSRELNTAFVESLNSLRSIRALRAESFVVSRYAEQIFSYVRKLFRIDAIRAGIRSLPAVLLLVIAAVALRRGSGLSLSEATFLAVTIIVIRIFASMGQFVSAATQLLTDIRAVHDIDVLIENMCVSPDSHLARSDAHVDRITLNDVHFGYGARSRILAGFTAEFVRGKTYAIVGPSGSGKSTLADILLGLVKPDLGSVSVNSGRVPLMAIRSKLMLVEQQPKIFSTSLRDNLLFGFSASDEKLWDALRLVDLEHTAKYMRNGLDTKLSYQGENFSGGQRQRIGIARALLRNPDLLILDEATSALDSATRQIVLDNVRRYMSNGILILITHDQHLVDVADEVIEFHQLNQLNTPEKHAEDGSLPGGGATHDVVLGSCL